MFYSLQLGGKVVWLECVEHCEQEISIDSWFTIEAEIGQISHHFWPLFDIFEHFRRRQLPKTRHTDLSRLLVLEVALAPVQDGAQVLHRAVAPLW